MTVGLVTALALIAQSGSADVIRVRNTHDSGPGSLRHAIAQAEPGDTIRVPRGHYELTTGALAFDKPLRIRGAGARRTVIDANGFSRVMEIGSSAETVHLTGLTIREGDTQDDGNGGAIDAGNPMLVLNRVAVLANRAEPDGNWHGGGIYALAVVARQSLFARNFAYNGGAISANSVKAVDSTFYRNTGGSPTANGDGGAVDSSDVVVVDSTMVENRCFNGHGCGGDTYGSALTVKGSILARNVAYEANGIAPGEPGNPGVADNCGGDSPTSEGRNLDEQGTCDLSGPGDISGKRARLGRFRNNGGGTNTLAPKRRSPAFNGGAQQCTKRDQRGVKRPQGRRCDIGAVEVKL